MLFSDKAIAKLMANFECSWEMVRPVPKVFVDFGNGNKLHRTIMGNVITWFCFADGKAYDLVPGVVTAAEYDRRLRQAWYDHRQCAKAKDRKQSVRRLHAQRTLAATAALLPELALAKTVVERPLKNAVTGKVIQPPRTIRWDPKKIPFVSKMRVERPIKQVVKGRADAAKTLVEFPLKKVAKAKTPTPLEQDTIYNKQHRDPLVHRMFAGLAQLPTPAAAHVAIFKDLLGVPLDDPFLGLAPKALGGEGGRVYGKK